MHWLWYRELCNGWCGTLILRVKFNKKNYLRYLGHLDLMRLFQRSFGRADIPIKYSEGFNPKPKLSIANPLSLGIESEEEYMDIELEDKIPVEDFTQKMNVVLPPDVQIIDGKYLEKGDSISSLISWALYEINFDVLEIKDRESLENITDKWLSKEEIIIIKARKKGKIKVRNEENIKSLIRDMSIKELDENSITIKVILKSGDNGNLRPLDFIDAFNRDNNLDMDIDSIMIKRLALYAEKDDKIYKPF